MVASISGRSVVAEGGHSKHARARALPSCDLSRGDGGFL